MQILAIAPAKCSGNSSLARVACAGLYNSVFYARQFLGLISSRTNLRDALLRAYNARIQKKTSKGMVEMADQIELQRKINEAAFKQVPSCARECTVPIVVVVDQAVRHHATGTLFRCADHFFVVTAGHVFKQASEHGKTLGIGCLDDNGFITLEGDTLVSAQGQHGTSADPFDVAIHRLTPEDVARISKKRFLLFDNIEFAPQSQAAVYTLFAFPGIWASSSTATGEAVEYKAIQYTTHRYDRDTLALDGYQEQFHLLLDGQLVLATNEDGSAADFCDLEGAAAPFPKGLGGVSGCSVWRIGDLSIPIRDWDIEKSKLVAVQTSVYHKKQAIKATRWIAVSTLIYEAYPELRPAMELWRL